MSKNKNKSIRKNDNNVLISNLELDPSVKFRVEEAYKSIRTNIIFSTMKKGCKTIVVSSSNPNDGKTTTTVNLAVAFAQAGQKILLIDCDLRKPTIQKYFNISSKPGLTDYLKSKVTTEKNSEKVGLSTVLHKTNSDNLYVLCAGSIPPNPAELLGSELMADFLKEISEMFDYILIDTPPINVVSDSLPIIRESDGIVIVVRSYKTTHPDIQRTLAALDFIDAKVLGFVVNSTDTHSSSYGYGKGRYGKYPYSRYGYGKYGYGYGYGYGYTPKDKGPFDRGIK